MVNRPKSNRLFCGFAALGLVLSACGGGTEEVASAEDSQEHTVADTEVTEPVDPPNNLARVDEDQPSDTDPGPFTGDPDSPWCTEMAVAGAESNPLSMDIFGLSASEMETQFSETAEVFARMETLAPDDIGQDVDEAADVFATFVGLGADAGWDLDVMLADPAFLAAFDLLALESAISQIERYTFEVCGIELARQ